MKKEPSIRKEREDVNKDISNNSCDRYNLNCVIKDETNNIIFNTRYNDFPWKKRIIDI